MIKLLLIFGLFFHKLPPPPTPTFTILFDDSNNAMVLRGECPFPYIADFTDSEFRDTEYFHFINVPPRDIICLTPTREQLKSFKQDNLNWLIQKGLSRYYFFPSDKAAKWRKT